MDWFVSKLKRLYSLVFDFDFLFLPSGLKSWQDFEEMGPSRDSDPGIAHFTVKWGWSSLLHSRF